jgi:aspartyl-tRNA(Asn)/glutamyl-tRNA(Gln) amidotransferase subunit A
VEQLASLTAGELLEAYRARVISPVEAVESLSERIEEHGPGLGAFSTLCLQRAREEARAAEGAYRRGEVAEPLAGVPIAVKDLFDTAGVRTTYGSPMFSDHVPSGDAVAVRLAREAGAILIGKTQTHEFGWGITSVNHLMGTSRNPWDLGRISGGSSGGSAVALAAHLVPLALGSDTGGSIRVPSAFCGTVGLKPTYGRVSAVGVFPLAPSLDHPGPMARNPADAAILFDAIAGNGRAEARGAGARRRGESGDGLVGTRIGLCPDLHLTPLAPANQGALDSVARAATQLGAELIEVALPEANGVFETFGAIQRAEALLTHTRAGLFPARREEYGEDVRARLEVATTGQPGDYLAATAARELLRAGFHRIFAEVDLLLTPVGAGSPPRIGEERVTHLGEETEFRELVMGYTVPQDLTGLPACTVRGGFDGLGIPIAVQLTGPPWRDWLVLAAAEDLFDATPEIQEPWPAGLAERTESAKPDSVPFSSDDR